ncbi:MAG: hypothetical protein EBZ78_08940 [Verrucomicrobia bacterium]|nr:hypothetical protein [Verrucomicrobiota bacterium]
MMNSKIPILVVFLAVAFTAWSEKTKEEKGKLAVKNGDFTDLTGLQEMPNAWHAGLPNGWSGLLHDSSNVWNDGTGNYIANVMAMSQTTPKFVAFTQEVGMVSASSEVTLTFEVSEPWRNMDFQLGAAIFDGVTDVPLAKGDFKKPGTYSVKADIVPSGTRVKIGFWAPMGTPGIDNVKIESKPLK